MTQPFKKGLTENEKPITPPCKSCGGHFFSYDYVGDICIFCYFEQKKKEEKHGAV